LSDTHHEEIVARLLKALDDCKSGVITKTELRSRFLHEAGVLEQQQWQIVQNLRTQAPEDQRELAQDVANLLEEQLRKGVGNA